LGLLARKGSKMSKQPELPNFDEFASEPGSPQALPEPENQAYLGAEFNPDELDFDPVREDDLAEIEPWFEENQYPPPEEPPPPESPSPPSKTKGWVMRSGKNPIAYFQLQKTGHRGKIMFAVKPSLRNRGLGKRLLLRAEHFLEVDVVELIVLVHENNIAGRKVLIATGYREVGKKGAFIEYKKRIVKFP